MTVQQPMPSIASPVVDDAKRLTTPWQRFFMTLWTRSGGSSGTGYYALLNGDQAQVFNVAQAAQLTEAPPLSQVQTMDNTVLTDAETFATNAANTAQSNAESFATSAANTAQANAETFATDQVRTLAGAALTTPAVGPSPFTWSAPSNGAVILTGGAVTALSLTRGGSGVSLTVFGAPLPVRSGDEITITYTSAPGMTWLPD